MGNPARIVIIDYTNWRGERRERRIVPLGIVFENNEWHPDTQWLLEAADCETGEIRSFAIKDIHSWRPAGAGPDGAARLAMLAEDPGPPKTG